MEYSNKTVVGVDTAKHVFQLHWVEDGGELVDLKLSRQKFVEHFANRAPCRIGLEACGGSQEWARRFRQMGHEVTVLPAQSVRAFVTGNKSDVQDARAIWTAVQHPQAGRPLPAHAADPWRPVTAGQRPGAARLGREDQAEQAVQRRRGGGRQPAGEDRLGLAGPWPQVPPVRRAADGSRH